jgi:hypothetical protein
MNPLDSPRPGALRRAFPVCGVEVWRGGLGGTYLLADPFVCRCLTGLADTDFKTHHSRYGLQTCQVAITTLYTRGFSSLVASTTALIATGWSEPVPGRVYPLCGPAPFHGAPENPVYKVVGAIKRHFWFCEPGVESRGHAKRAFIVRPLTPRAARHHSVQTKRSFVLFRIPFPLSTKARSFESLGVTVA